MSSNSNDMNGVSSPRILAIIVNWNKRDALVRLLESLPAASTEPFDVVVVDNASTDDSVEVVRTNYPHAHTVINPENLGGTGGFNSGLRYGLQHPNKYELLWLLDNDVVATPACLDGLVAAISSNPKVGLVGSTVTLIDDMTHVQEVGAHIDWKTGAPERVGEGPLSNLERPRMHEVDYVAACSLLARSAAVREVGIWDPNYFLMWDDMEWGIRFNRAGWKVVATTESLIGHESFDKRRSAAPIASAYLWNRNAYYCMSKFCPGGLKPRMFFHRFRVELAWADNFEMDGFEMEANGIRTAIRDYFDNRMGKPPQQLFKHSPPPEPWQPIPVAKRSAVKRIALIGNDNPAWTRMFYDLLKAEFPNAHVDTLVFATREELLREHFENRRLMRGRTVLDRARLAWTLSTQYDAVAAAIFTPRHFWEKFVKYSLRINVDQTWQAKRRDIGEIFNIIFRRARALVLSGVYTIRALVKPKPQPNYFDF